LGSALWAPESAVGLRRVLTLVRGLPFESSFHQAVAGEAAWWTLEAQLIATLIELTDAARQGTVVGFAKQGSRPNPMKIPRPGPKKKRREATVADMVAIFGAPSGRN